jgi:hypothetical protein
MGKLGPPAKTGYIGASFGGELGTMNPAPAPRPVTVPGVDVEDPEPAAPDVVVTPTSGLYEMGSLPGVPPDENANPGSIDGAGLPMLAGKTESTW